MINILRDSINEGKSSGSIQNTTITYFASDLSKLLVKHPTLENVEVLKNSFVTKAVFDVEVSNAFNQWALILNDTYSSYVDVKFKKVKTEDADIVISFDSKMLTAAKQVENNIYLNSDLNWASNLHPKGLLLLNNLIYHIGGCLGVSRTSKISPMNSKFLSLHYPTILNISINEDSTLIEPILTQYSSIRNEIVNTYGTSTTDTPLIYGCTNSSSSNYNSEATFNDGSCIENTIVPSEFAKRSIAYRSGTTNTEYYLATNTEAYAYNADNLTTDILELDLSSGITSGTSFVITDKGSSDWGDSSGLIRYYVLYSNDNDTISIYNNSGNLLSNLNNVLSPAVIETRASFSDADFKTLFNFYYSYQGEYHYLYWQSKNGYLHRLKFNDESHQLAAGEELYFCDSDTNAYGNVVEYNKLNYHAVPADTSGNRAVVNSDGKLIIPNSDSSVDSAQNLQFIFHATYVPHNYTQIVLGSYAPHDLSAGPTMPSTPNLKLFVMPTVGGKKIILFSDYTNMVSVGNLDPYLPTNVDTVRFTSIRGDNSAPAPASYYTTGLDRVRNTTTDLDPIMISNSESQSGSLTLRPFSLGFSFDSIENNTKGILGISSNKYVNGRFATYVTEDSDLYSSLPVSIGNKLFNNTFFGVDTLSRFITYSPNLIGYGNSFQEYGTTPRENLNHVGDFHLAIAVKHGFILTKINNTNFSLVSPTTEAGLEVHVSGGNPLMDNFNDGWTPISMQFSPDDNFLYTIIRNPEDHEDKKIAIYNIYGGADTSGCVEAFASTTISDTCIIIEDQFNGDLEKITLQDDGAIYIWSTGNEYYKVSNPDFQASADKLFFESEILTTTKSFTPSTSFNRNAVTWSFSKYYLQHQGITTNINKYTAVFNSSIPGVAKGAHYTPLTNLSYNPLLVGSGYTYNSETNTVTPNIIDNGNYLPVITATQTFDTESNDIALSMMYFKSSNTIKILGFDNEVIINSAGEDVGTISFPSNAINDHRIDSQNSLFILPVSRGLYMCGYINPDVGITDISISGSTRYSYRIVKIERNTNPYSETKYIYEVSETLGTMGVTNNAFSSFAGIGISKLSEFNYCLYQVATNTNTISSEDSTLNLVTVRIEINPDLNLSLDNTPIINSTSTKSLHINNDDGHAYTNHLTDFSSTINFAASKSAVITVSKDLKFISISANVQIADTEATVEEVSSTISTTHVYNLDPATGEIGDNVGQYIALKDTDFLVGTDLSTSVNQKQVVRSSAFSPNNQKLYILVGVVGSQISSLQDSSSVSSLSKYSRVLRLNVDSTADTLDFDGALNEAPQIVSSGTRAAQDMYSYENGYSTQGDAVLNANSLISELSLRSDGNIETINIQSKTINSPTLGGELNIVLSSGFITNPNAASSVLNKNARTITDAEFSSLGISSRIARFDNNPEYEDLVDDDFDVAVADVVPIKFTYGCTDPLASNYNASATLNTGCVYSSSEDQTSECDTNVGTYALNNGITVGGASGIDTWMNSIPMVVENINLVMNNKITQCGGMPQRSTDYISAEDITIAIDYNSSYANETCGCQKTYVIIASASLNTASAPWPGLEDCNGILSVSVKFIYIPYADSDGDSTHPGGVSQGVSYFPYIATSGPSNFMLEQDFDPAYCINCIGEDTPNFDTLGYGDSAYSLCVDPSLDPSAAGSESYYPWCTGTIDINECGRFGCTDSSACNYDSTATVTNNSCTYSETGTNVHGIDVGSLCGCDGWLNSASGLDYCGDCDNPDDIKLKQTGCDCNGDLKLAPSGVGYYADCAGTLPTATEAAHDCFYDSNGILQEPAGGVPFDCDCQGTTVDGPYCDCDGNLEQYMCDCDTPSTLYYKKESDSDLVACIGAQAYHICQLTQSFYDAHPDIDVLSSIYVAYVMEPMAPGGNPLTSNKFNDWTQGPLSLAACEQCAEESAGGQPQEYNCNGDCKYLVSTAGDTFGTQLNLTYEYWQLNDCDQCVNVANALPGVLEDCCDEDAQGNPITDECGACINQIGPNQVKVTAVAEGGYTVEHSGGTITTDCSPCSILQTGVDYNYESLYTALQMVQADECQGCDTDWIIKDSGPKLGYYYSANQLQYKCSCDSTPVSNTEQVCCPGYFYDNCAYNGVGGCVASGTAPIEKECNGNCPTNGEYLYGPNECSECALLSEGNGLNAVGCCGNKQKGCDDICYPAGEAPEELACGCNDATSCLGCTDTTASNFNSSATVDDGSCTYDVLETLYDTLDAVVINNDGAAAILEEAYFIGISERNLTQINANKLIIPSPDNTSGFETFIDQAYYTFKCQVISISNPILYLENPETNAEVLYTAPSSGENESNLAQVNSNMDIDIVAGATASYTAIYYFRLSSDLNLTTYNTLTLFNSIGDKLERIRNADGESVMFDYNFNSFDLETGYNSNINPVTDTEPNSTLTANVYNVYSVTMKINPDTGQPYNKTLDFSDFIYEEIPGCMDQNAINFNPNANVIGEDCQYEEVGEGLTISITGENVIPEKLKWVIYDQSNNIVKYNLGNYSDAFETDSAYTLNIGNITYNCLYFVPIGYKYEDAWQNVKLVISENGSVIHKILNYGIEAKNISLDNRGTIAIGGSSCNLGCGNTSFNELHTDYCVANVRKDSIEFTSIDFTLELNAYSSAVVVEVYNLDLGNTLLRFEEIDEISVEYKDSFTIDKNTRVGIRINNPDNVGLKYSMVSEFGEIILKKTIK